MSSSDEGGSTSNCSTPDSQKKYIGVRRRKWGKWVSEIRVPGTQDRLWLGSYSTPEAAAVAHDIASYCLRGPSSLEKLNFPLTLPAGVRTGMSPTSVQKAASDAGMAIDAQFAMKQPSVVDVTDGCDGKMISGEKVVDGFENERWRIEEGSFGNWEGRSSEVRGGESLNISVEDYL
ncbi:hypothetical protein RHGRI_033057 [Rhododendron griersonianum]|uniref:AP2/ERF domain-containing protein n=1 Tax=Rhododendron griersonianum TaxID=479676 RepID=A0AAV6I0U1_9ERIC|nr:hypothetical protein RHGRI_033057 [Rhododendron griersonianum]